MSEKKKTGEGKSRSSQSEAAKNDQKKDGVDLSSKTRDNKTNEKSGCGCRCSCGHKS
ncbi:hypothetical protein FACS1894152_4020 [Bacilli bacterium]|nr:hypothetical protein FACS1894152_4020 [Bacilli bacterium]